MLLLVNLMGSLFVILGVIVAALAVPDFVWKRRSIIAASISGGLWLAVTAVAYIISPENAESVQVLATFMEQLVSNRLVQVVAAFALGVCAGVVGRQGIRRFFKDTIARSRKQQWFSG